jgi:peptide/nickel transport system substrate-binding protein
MLRTRLMAILGLLVVASMILSACGGATAQPTEPPQQQATEPPQATEAPPTEVPTPTTVPVTRTGPWVDELVFSEQPDNALCIAQLQANEVDSCADGNTNPDDFKTVQADPNLAYPTGFGLNFELLLNPIPTFADGRVNPFGNVKIRQAMNMLVDRSYVIQEIFGGLGAAKFSNLVGVFPDYAKYIDVNRALEAKYAYNLDKATEIITTEMEGLGATKNADGKWEIDGEPVTLIFIIRTEDERTPIGDYVSNQLESVGFTVDRQYKARSEASPIWARSEPTEGQWNLYTGGWIVTAISRDDGGNFGFYDTDFGGCCGLSSNFLTAEVLGQEYYDTAQKLFNNEFGTMEERGELFKKALDLSRDLSYHVWVIDTQAFFPQRKELVVAADLAGGVSGASLYPYTIRLGDTEGGAARIALQDIFIDPWNPVGGSNWISDTMPIRATQDYASISDPYTGLAWPQRAESLTVTAKEGLPMTSALDWVTLNFQAEDIAVPAEAWADWDATNQKFITVGEKFPEGATSLVKVTWTYPADLFEKNAWHDGSPLSVADFVMGMIMTFDPGKPESGLYDEAYVPALETFLATFKGVQIDSTDPLVISTYTDSYALDAETFGLSWYPADGGTYSQGPAAWHNLAPAVMAEMAGEIAFTTDKAAAKEVEWTSFIDGPALEIQKKYLDQALAEGTIPFAPTMSEFVTADEATARYENLNTWFGDHGHLWLGTGPFFLDQVFTAEGNAVLKRNENFPDLADKWSRFSAPKTATVDLSGDGNVVSGQEATFDVFVTDNNNEPYPADELSGVKYLVFNANNELVATGDAEPVADGQYVVTLGPDVTSGLEAGANRIEVAVTSNLVSIPSFASFEFVTVK